MKNQIFIRYCDLIKSLGSKFTDKEYLEIFGSLWVLQGPLPEATPNESDQIRPNPTKSDHSD